MSRLTAHPRALLVAIGLMAAIVAGQGVVLAAAVVKKAGPVTAVKTATADSLQQVTSTSWTDVTSMSFDMTVPSGQKALLVVTFSAETNCYTGAYTGYCNLRVIVDGHAAAPDFVQWGQSICAACQPLWEVHSMQFVAGPLNAGVHTVKVQAMVPHNGNGETFQLTHRTLTVLRSKV